jgi:sugar phosphate isomerase/epimerase
MELGIFARTFQRPTVEETFDAIAAHGLHAVQFNMACVGLPSMPDRIAPEVSLHVRREAKQRAIEIAALSGTFNMAHPDPRVRATGLRRLRVLATACAQMGTTIITLSTGTRDPEDLWRRHPDNESDEAWRDLLDCMAAALECAEAYGVTLAFEPERANVASTAAKSRELLNAMNSRYLGVVIDPANLFDAAEADRLPWLLEEAFGQLGERIVLAHAKDRGPDHSVQPAGEGIVPWDRYIEYLQSVGYTGALVLHGLGEAQVAAAVEFLRSKM